MWRLETLFSSELECVPEAIARCAGVSHQQHLFVIVHFSHVWSNHRLSDRLNVNVFGRWKEYSEHGENIQPSHRKTQAKF